MIVCGCDVGAGTVKLVVMEDKDETILFSHAERIRKRNPVDVVEDCFSLAEKEGYRIKDFAYIASTGEGEPVEQRTGHFYSMTCHARGAKFFCPEAKSALDMGSLHMRAMKLDGRGKVLEYKMTGQCASGTGQFLENIARYLGVTMDEVPQLSLQSTSPEAPSTICAVLAETDVINLVSKAVPLPDIIRGIHESVAERAAKLVSRFGVASPMVLTGGLATDAGLVRCLEGKISTSKNPVELVSPEQAIFAGAIGAALWGGHRYRKLAS